MKKKESYGFAYDPVAALHNAPTLLGMELRPCGPNKLCGAYYINGEPHPWRRDKIKAFIWKGGVFISEEGGQCLSLTNWLQQYGGAADYKEALKMIKGESQALHWDGQVRAAEKTEIKYVPQDVLLGAKAYDLQRCPLFRWFCHIFPEQKVREAFDLYNVTTDSNNLAVFWFVDQNQRIVHDKRVRYLENGHRDKTFGGSRNFCTYAGYSGRCFFGAHLIGDNKEIRVVESEKSALALYMLTGKVTIATAGKNNLKEKDPRFLAFPDIDAVEDWTATGNTIVEWWNIIGDRIPIGQTDDICDIIEKAPQYGVNLLDYSL